MRKTALTLIILTAMLVPMVNAVTIDGPMNFMREGGYVRLGNDGVSNQITVANTVYRFSNLIITRNTETLGFDCATGQIMTINSVTVSEINYNVTGVQATYINRPGYGPPTEITGGTATYDATTQITTVTPAAAGGIIVRWDSDQNRLFNNLLTYLSLATMIPIIIGIAYVWQVYQTGEFNPAVASLIAGIVIALVVIAAMFANYV